jgi:hypothetical protein
VRDGRVELGQSGQPPLGELVGVKPPIVVMKLAALAGGLGLAVMSVAVHLAHLIIGDPEFDVSLLKTGLVKKLRLLSAVTRA